MTIGAKLIVIYPRPKDIKGFASVYQTSAFRCRLRG